MAQIIKNNLFGVLSTNLSSSATAMNLVDASNFPAPTAGDYYVLTLVGLNANAQEDKWEIVKVTAKAGNTLTIQRAQESTTARNWDSGTSVQMRITAGSVTTPFETAKKQDILVSGTHVKTLNNEALVGSGNITLTKSSVGLNNVDNTSDANKPVSTATQTALNTKVDKVTGKQLSTEDFTTTEKTKLASIEAEANKYIHPTTPITPGAYKIVTVNAAGHVTAGENPTTLTGFGITDAADKVHTHSASDINTGTLSADRLATSGVSAGTYKSVTVDTKGRVTGGSNPTTLSGYGITDAAPSSHVGSSGTAHAVATTATAGFMASTDKAKLDGIATGANNYSHPTGDGNLHVPATGTSNSGKVLKAGATAGSLSWGTLTHTDVGAAPTSHVHDANAITAGTLAVDRLPDSGVTAGTYAKTTVDAKGRVTSGSGLSASDIPDLDASKITSGSLSADRLTTSGVTAGTYTKVTVDNKGRVTSGNAVISLQDVADSPYKDAVIVATTANLTGAYVNGSSGVGATLTNNSTLAALAVDGVTLVAGDRILVKNQTTAAHNGIYVVTNPGSASVAWVLTRTVNSDTAPDLAGAIVTIDQGTSNGAKIFTTSFKSTDTVGTTSCTWLEVPTVSSNVASATKLATARQINGTNFDGTGNITTANWGTARTLSFTGDATGSSSVNGSANVATALTLANSGVTAGTYTKITVDSKGRATVGANLSASDIPALDASKITSGIIADAQLSGTYTNVNITGNAASATKLETSRTINGVSFDGTANITVSDSTKLPLSGGTLSGDISIVKNNAWLTVDSASSGGNGVEQGAGISIGENGYKGSAAMHLTYTGDGKGWIGMGTVDAVTGIPAYPAIELYYTDNNIKFAGNTSTSGTANAATFNATSLTNGGFQGIDADTATTPSFTWTGDLDTGIFRPAADVIGFTAGGVERGRVNTTGFSGDGSQLIALNASNISSGTLSADRLATSGATAGTYTKVTVDNKGRVTASSSLAASDIPNLDWSKINTGKPTTLSGYGITDAQTASRSTATFTTATNGWYRIATSAVGISRNSGEFIVDWTVNSHHGSVRFAAASHFGATAGTSIMQMNYASFSTSGVKAARIVYNTSYSGNYAYVEVQFGGALTNVQVNVELQDPIGWTLVTPSTAGSIPSGYTSYTHDFIAATSITSGTYPKVTINQEGRVVSGASLAAGDIPSLDASKITSGTIADARLSGTYTGVSITGNADTATKLATARTIALTGDVTYTSEAFDGSGNVTGTATLANSGVTAGTYPKVTVDTKGRVTAGTSLVAGDIPNLDASKITSGTLSVARGGTGATTITGLIKGNGTSAFSAAVAGTDYVIPSGSITGNASTATALATARTINGTSFNGSANITTANWGTARNLTIGSTAKSVNGSANVSWSLAEIGAAASSHNHDAENITSGTLNESRLPTTLTNKTLSNVTLNNGYTEEVFAISGTTPALNPANGSIQTWTLTGNSTPTDSLAAGQSIVLMLTGASTYTVTWPSVSWKTGKGNAPTLVAGTAIPIVLWKIGATLYGARVGDA